jgi:hypothetical protein
MTEITVGLWISAESKAVSFRVTAVQYNALRFKNSGYLNFNQWRLLFDFLCAAVQTLTKLTLFCNYDIQSNVPLLSK